MDPPIPEKYRNVSSILEDYSFISVNCCIFPGVIIGEGTVVVVGSIVRKDLELWGIYIMKNGKMIKIKDRNKRKTHKIKEKLIEEYKMK